MRLKFLRNKYSRILPAALVIIMMTACSRQAKPEETMVIKPSEFSKETQEVLKILDDEISFFDYSVDETVKAMRIDIWTCENGEWTAAGNTYGNLDDREGRIAVRINDAAFDIFDIDETGNVKTSYKSTVDFSESKTIIASSLQNSKEIKPGEEISLWVKLGYDTSQAVSPGITGNFREADCDSGVAVTAVFSVESAE